MTDPAVRRQWYERNKEVINERHREWRERNGDREAEYSLEYRRRNRDYLNRRVRRRDEALRQIPAPRSMEPWTEFEDGIVARDDLYSIKEMAYRTGRSYKAVIARRSLLRHGAPPSYVRRASQCASVKNPVTESDWAAWAERERKKLERQSNSVVVLVKGKPYKGFTTANTAPCRGGCGELRPINSGTSSLGPLCHECRREDRERGLKRKHLVTESDWDAQERRARTRTRPDVNREVPKNWIDHLAATVRKEMALRQAAWVIKSRAVDTTKDEGESDDSR